MTWLTFTLIGAACGFVTAGLVGGKRGTDLIVAIVEGAVTALVIWVVLAIFLKIVFGLLPIIVVVVAVFAVLWLLGVGKKS